MKCKHSKKEVGEKIRLCPLMLYYKYRVGRDAKEREPATSESIATERHIEKSMLRKSRKKQEITI